MHDAYPIWAPHVVVVVEWQICMIRNDVRSEVQLVDQLLNHTSCICFYEFF